MTLNESCCFNLSAVSNEFNESLPSSLNPKSSYFLLSIYPSLYITLKLSSYDCHSIKPLNTNSSCDYSHFEELSLYGEFKIIGTLSQNLSFLHLDLGIFSLNISDNFTFLYNILSISLCLCHSDLHFLQSQVFELWFSCNLTHWVISPVITRRLVKVNWANYTIIPGFIIVLISVWKVNTWGHWRQFKWFIVSARLWIHDWRKLGRHTTLLGSLINHSQRYLHSPSILMFYCWYLQTLKLLRCSLSITFSYRWLP